jgi:cytochrome b6-f complex iron-sulfur subunit
MDLIMTKKKTEQALDNQKDHSRRSFLNILWLSLGFVALVEFITVAFAFLRPDKAKARRERSDTIVTGGVLDQFIPNSVTAFVRGRFYLARLEDGGFLALSRKCTHLGCTVPWVVEESKFICPCHGSSFDITGNVINTPAPRALDMYPVIIENDIVKVDTGNPLKRSEFRADQVTYPKILSDRITG